MTNLAVAAALDPGRWQNFLDELGQVLGTRICTQLIGYDQLTNAAPLAYSSGYDPAILHLYETLYADKNPFAANFSKCAVGRSISTDELCETEILKKTDFYADLLRPMEDIYGGGGSMLAFDADRMFLIGGNLRAKDREKYEHEWLQLCVQLAPVIRQSLEINRMISGLSFEKWAAERHLLGVGTAIFVIDPTMLIHFACSKAHELLAKGTLVGSAINRRLQFRSEQAQNQFSAFVRYQARESSNAFSNLQMVDEDGHGWICRAMGVRLGDRDDMPFSAFMTKSVSAILLAIKPNNNYVTIQEKLQAELGLSPVEAASACMLSEGKTLAEIADNRQVSVFTVRNQIKSALAKSGCRRQAELVRKIEQLRLQGIF
ncbi:MAG: helix-turn-helix transcriptional regulator [Roseibium sp.]|uniref:helix-turn-helix transcriptional regulator n=1 Tax=Roseibium sp. TaxID=1936156 RepID=UPI00260ECC07|nr:helix-turn-helix transcriptional regulator [Roseibium sp.]MCV0428364.1 helix-turn-helix transcriptional regulator [Roseibium sp.]